MNRNSIITIAALLFLISGYVAHAQSDVNQESTEYQIETRLDNYTRPITFTPTKATPVNGAITENIVTTTQNILNKEAMFLKKGLVKPVGEDEFSAWEMLSDEGGKEHSQTAPNPLTYYAAGASSSLLTQVERMIQIMDLEIDEVKVESKIYFRWSDAMTDHWTGYTDKVISNILIESKESPETIAELKERALQAWAVGEGLANSTPIDVGIVINADEWAGLEARPGRVGSPISIDNGRTITNVTPDLDLQTVDIEPDFSVELHQFDYQQDNFMTPTMTGHLDGVITRVIVTSDATEEESTAYAKQALAMCFAGEGVQKATEMESNVYLNGRLVD